MERILAEQAERLAKQLQDRDMAGRTIGIKVRTDDFSTYTRVRSIDRVTNEAETIAVRRPAAAARERAERPVRLLGVRVAAFAEPPPSRPGALSLIESPSCLTRLAVSSGPHASVIRPSTTVKK